MKRLQHWLIWLPSALALIAILYALPTLKKKNNPLFTKEESTSFSIQVMEKELASQLSKQSKSILTNLYQDTIIHQHAFRDLAHFWQVSDTTGRSVILTIYYDCRYLLTAPNPTTQALVQKGRMTTLLAMNTENNALHNMLLDWAIALFQKAAALSPKNDSILVDIAATPLWYKNETGQIHNPMTSIATLKEILKNNPRQTYAMYLLGMASIMSGQQNKAIEYFTKVLQIEPNAINAMTALEHLFRSQNKQQQADYWSTKIRKINPEKKEHVE